jgi:flagellar assembly protein FliH
MSVSHRYKNFGDKPKTSQKVTAQPADSSLEEQKLESFESGYQAGWEDATKAQSDHHAKISAELEQSLQEISFTYHEAVAKLTSSFQPVLTEVIAKVLPEISKQSFILHLSEQVNTLISETLDRPIEITVSPENEEQIKMLAGEFIKEPFTIVVAEYVGENGVFVRLGQEERQIDLQGIVDQIKLATDAFFHEVAEQQNHG